MTHSARASVIGALILVAAILWLACNSGGSSSGTFTPSCEALGNLERYRYTYFYEFESPQPTGPIDEAEIGDPPFAVLPNSGSFTFSQRFIGEFVSPDRFSIEIETPSAPDSPTLPTIIIGNQQWIKLGNLWTESAVPNAFPPLRVCEAILTELDLEGLPFTSETVNGREARRFQLDAAPIRTIALLHGPVSDMGRLLTTPSVEIWITDEGWPAKVVIKDQADYPSGRELLMEISLDITDVDAGDIVIEPPR